MMRGMADGQIVRVEELTRIPADVQDSLITVLSEKTLPIPELGEEVQATKGFNVIATANDRDKGVNELSSALKRRFNVVVLPLPATADEEVEIVRGRVEERQVAAQPPERLVRLDHRQHQVVGDHGRHGHGLDHQHAVDEALVWARGWFDYGGAPWFFINQKYFQCDCSGFCHGAKRDMVQMSPCLL